MRLREILDPLEMAEIEIAIDEKADPAKALRKALEKSKRAAARRQRINAQISDAQKAHALKIQSLKRRLYQP